ncbi:MAG: class I SAM-dependent methyltransferase [Bryobacteraceae bacterium]
MISSRLHRFASAVLAAVPGYSRFRFRQLGGSAAYWDRRYRDNGDSGAGSYGRLAEFKAGVLNEFVEQRQIGSVVEFGCGDGNQLSLARYPRYLGLDVSPTAVRRCADRFGSDPSKSFLHYDPHAWSDRAGFVRADAALSLDVLYHLIEDDIYRLHLDHLFAAAGRFTVIYSSDTDEPAPTPHVRPRQFSRDVAARFPNFRLDSVLHFPGTTDFTSHHSGNTPASFYFYRRIDGPPGEGV